MEKSQNRKPFQALRDLFHPVDLTHGTCWRTILQFSLPVILSYLLQQVYTISDAAIVGQTLTAQEVAGVNDTASLVFIFLQFAFGVSAGFCVITSLLRGLPGSGRCAPLHGRPAGAVGGADGAADSSGAGAAEPHAGLDQRDAGEPGGIPGRLHLLRHHLRRHRRPAVL